MKIAFPYFAWVEPEEKTFGSEHYRYDEVVYSASLDHAEGSIPLLTIEIKNPGVGILSRKTWAWLSVFDGTTFHPMFFGRVVGVPEEMTKETLILVLTARPEDYFKQQQKIAEELKVAPFYDPVFVDEAKRDDPNTVLEAYSRLWHVGRYDQTVSTSDILIGEDGVEDFEVGTHLGFIPYDSISSTLEGTPITSVRMTATVQWTQTAIGYVDFGTIYIPSYSGDGIVSEWPKPGSGLQGGWTCSFSVCIDSANIANAMTASWSFSWTNKEKTHNDGDTMSLNISVSEPQLNGPVISGKLLEIYQTGILDPFAVDEDGDPAPINIPASAQVTSMSVPMWQVYGSMILRYDAARQRTEHLSFLLQSDLQPILKEPLVEEYGEAITLSGVNVGMPLLDLKNWLSVAGQPVELGQVIFPSHPLLPGAKMAQIAVVAGTCGLVEPEFSQFIGETVVDGTVTWSSLGASNPNSTIGDWTPLTDVQLGGMILPRDKLVIAYSNMVRAGLSMFPPIGTSVSMGQMVKAPNGTYQVCKLSGTTARGISYASFGLFYLGSITAGEPFASFATTWGAETVDGSVVWVCLGYIIPDGTHNYICTKAGKTALYLPSLNHTVGSVSIDGDVEWTNVGFSEIPVGGTPNNVTRRSYFPTDRGLLSAQYLMLIARAHLLLRSRVQHITFECTFERVIQLSCRKNALIHDRRLPGGQAFGKIISYNIKIDGATGVMMGKVTIACAVGSGDTVTETAGDPVYAAPGYMVGYQQYKNKVIIVPQVGDVGFSKPVDAINDDGLVFPLDRQQVILTDRIVGSLAAQASAIRAAIGSAKAAAVLGTLKPNNPIDSIRIQQSMGTVGENSVTNELKNNPIWLDRQVKPVTNGPFQNEYTLRVTKLMVPRQIDLEATSSP